MEAAARADATDTALERAASGDEVAFARIVATHSSDMSRIAYLICGDLELAQEAVQSAWPMAWRNIAKIRDAEKLRPWLMAIAGNEARRVSRRRRRISLREIALDPEVGQAPLGARDDLAEHATHIDLANAIAALSPRDRTIVGMRYAVGLTSAEIGAAIGMSSGGVRARLATLLRTLRRELEDD